MSREVHIKQEGNEFTVTSTETQSFDNSLHAFEQITREKNNLQYYNRVLTALTVGSFTTGSYFIYQGFKQNDTGLVGLGFGLLTGGLNFIWPSMNNGRRIQALNEKITVIKSHIEAKNT